MNTKSILFVNPWIHDFAAYDFWSKPLGLLQVGGFLQQYGFDVQLLDCLDRYHPVLTKLGDMPPEKPDGTGKYWREIIPKPAVLDHIPRHYARYGMPRELVREQLLALPRQPDLVLLTSIMTYWYTGVKEMRDLLKALFPDTPIILGGIYASLCPDHAAVTVKPDYLFTGHDLSSLLGLIGKILQSQVPATVLHDSISLQVAWDLYPDLHTMTMMTSRGCPNRCSFCASHALYSGYYRYAPGDVFRDILYWHERTGFQHLAFYDDALLHKPDDYIKPLLKMIAKANLPIKLHTPNGLQPRYVDDEFAELFRQAGGHTVRLSFESVNPERQRDMSSKVTTTELTHAVHCLKHAGIPANQIGVYIMMGLPGQTMQEVSDSVDYAANLNVKVNLASFSPIPGTKEWDRLLASGEWTLQNDLLLTNTTVYPLWTRQYGYDTVQTFVSRIREQLRSIET